MRINKSIRNTENNYFKEEFKMNLDRGTRIGLM